MVESQWGPKIGKMDSDIKDLRNSDQSQIQLLRMLDTDLRSLAAFLVEHGPTGTKKMREELSAKMRADIEERQKIWDFAQKRAASGNGMPGGRIPIPGGQTKAVVKTKIPAGTITAADKAFKESQSK